MSKSSFVKICLLFLTLIIVILVGYNIVTRSLDSQLNRTYSYHQGDILESFEKTGLWFECERTSDFWQTGEYLGAQYDLNLFNFLSYDLCDWKIIIEVPDGSYVDAFWNGIFQIKDDKLYITSVSYNEVIRNQGYPIGFIMYIPDVPGAESWVLKDISMTYKIYLQVHDLTSFWVFIGFIIFISILIVVYVVLLLRIAEAKKLQLIYKDITEQALSTFANAIDAKDNYTEGHSRRVALFAREIARRMRLKYEKQEEIFYIAMMHDIGKIGIPDRILNKPTRLTDEEWEIMQKHPIYSGEILKEFTAISDMASAVKYHHEWYDGTGYPYKLKGEEIPFVSRIITVADSFDTMDSKRVYRDPLPKEEIIKQLRENAGRQFDPEIVPYMIAMLEDGAVERLKQLI